MLTSTDRIAILLHEGTESSKGKTGVSLLDLLGNNTSVGTGFPSSFPT